jgi:lysophospholipase L1-like esterase
LMTRLHAGGLLTVVAYGMSITRGMDVSGYDKEKPYMPNYVSLFMSRFCGRYHVMGRLENAALPGSTVAWGAEHAEQYVNPLHPDLVILDFGMNDFWRLTPQAFGDSVRTIMRKVKTANPDVAFLLLANMKFDPDYVLESDVHRAFYMGNLAGYAGELKAMKGPGVAVLDMTGLSAAIYARKKPKDCLVNPLHPNDYMARWYAQGMLAVMCP